MELLLARLHQPPVSYQSLYERMRNQSGTVLIDFLNQVGKENFMTYSVHQSCQYELKSAASAPPLLMARPRVHVAGKPFGCFHLFEKGRWGLRLSIRCYGKKSARKFR